MYYGELLSCPFGALCPVHLVTMLSMPREVTSRFVIFVDNVLNLVFIPIQLRPL